MRSHVLSVVVTLLVGAAALLGVRSFADQPVERAPAASVGKPPASYPGQDVRVEISGDMVVTSTQLPDGCELEHWAAYALLGGVPKITGVTETPSPRCTYLDDATGHKATYGVIPGTGDGSLPAEQFAATIPTTPELRGALLTRPRIEKDAWAQVDETPSGLRRFVIVWQSTTDVRKFVVRRTPKGTREQDLREVVDIAEKVSRYWTPLDG